MLTRTGSVEAQVTNLLVADVSQQIATTWMNFFCGRYNIECNQIHYTTRCTLLTHGNHSMHSNRGGSTGG